MSSRPAAPPPTARLSFEALGTAHAAQAAPFLVDRAMWRYIPRALSTAAEVERRFAAIAVVERPNGDRWLNWVMRRRTDAQALGLVEVTAHPDGRAYLAYFVFVPFQKRGYAREGGAAVLAHLRDACAIHFVEAEADTRNAASHRVLEALGFVRDDAPIATDPIAGEPAWDYRYRLALAPPSA